MTAFITPTDLAAFLSVTPSADNNTALQAVCDSACQMVVDRCGPILPTQFLGEVVEVTASCYRSPSRPRVIILRNQPVISVDAVRAAYTGTSWVSPWSPSSFFVDTETGIIRLTDGTAPYGVLSIDYTAGRSVTAPAWATGAALIIGVDLWKARRVSLKQNQGSDSVPSSTFTAIPPQASNLLEPHLRGPGIR